MATETKPAPRRGVFTYYPEKDREPVTINLTTDAHRRMKVIKEASHASRGDVLEHYFRKGSGLPVNKDLDALLKKIKF